MTFLSYEDLDRVVKNTGFFAILGPDGKPTHIFNLSLVRTIEPLPNGVQFIFASDHIVKLNDASALKEFLFS